MYSFFISFHAIRNMLASCLFVKLTATTTTLHSVVICFYWLFLVLILSCSFQSISKFLTLYFPFWNCFFLLIYILFGFNIFYIICLLINNFNFEWLPFGLSNLRTNFFMFLKNRLFEFSSTSFRTLH